MPKRTVSVVVPVKSSQNSIRQLCVSLLDQTHKPLEIILVGTPDDSTWDPIQDLIRNRRVITIGLKRPADHYGRDSNLKRQAGCNFASGQIIAVTDSDMEMPQDWIANGLRLMHKHQVDSVAGIIWSYPKPKSVKQGFLNRYTDRSYPAKTPRFPDNCIIRKKNFGHRKVLPISANWMFTRRAYMKSGGFDPTFSLSYEDYSLAWQMVSAGYGILCTHRLWGYHHHRQDFGSLFKEYVKSGRGCASFICRYPKSPLSRKRLRQVLAVLSVLILGCIGLVVWPWTTLCVGLLGYLSSAALNIRNAGIAGILFPAISLILGNAFMYGTIRGMIDGGRACPEDQHYAEMHPKL